MTDAWAHRAQNQSGVETTHAEGRAAELTVLVDSVTLHHQGPDQNYRPYLHLAGELRTVRLEEPLPYKISTVTYDVGHGDRVDAYYEFDDTQLQEMTRKGYFSKGFSVPEQIVGLEWELPAVADALVVAPPAVEGHDQAPVVFLRVQDVAHLQVDLESTGYDLAAYFEDFSGQVQPAPMAVLDGTGLRSRGDELNSLFRGEVAFDPTTQETVHTETRREPEAADPTGLRAGLSEIESQLESEQADFEAERAIVPGSPEQLYADRVAAAPREGEGADTTPDETKTAESGALDLDDLDGQFGYEEVGAGSSAHKTLEQRKRELAATVADLDHGDHEHDNGIDR